MVVWRSERRRSREVVVVAAVAAAAAAEGRFVVSPRQQYGND